MVQKPFESSLGMPKHEPAPAPLSYLFFGATRPRPHYHIPGFVHASPQGWETGSSQGVYSPPPWDKTSPDQDSGDQHGFETHKWEQEK